MGIKGLLNLTTIELAKRVRGLDKSIKEKEAKGQLVRSSEYALKNIYKNEIKRRGGSK